MTWHKIHEGSLVNAQDEIVTVSIERDMETAPTSVGELTFPYDCPISIERDADGKMTPLQGSTLTLTLMSPGDRTYLDLYTTTAGSIRASVSIGGSLFWRGYLDPELYEEPFSALKDYDVTLTFTDMGILERTKFVASSHMVSVADVLQMCVKATGLTGYSAITSTYLSATDTSTNFLTALTVRSDNFCDEDGVWSSLGAVLEAMLTPLALVARQRNGALLIYDLNALATTTSTTTVPRAQIEWDGEDQRLGVDTVANSVKITFSPYASADVIKEDAYTYKGTTSMSDISSDKGVLTSTGYAKSDGQTLYAWYPDYGDRSSSAGSQDYALISFALYTGNGKDSGLESISGSVTPGKIFPVLGGESRDVVVHDFYTSGHTASTIGTKTHHGSYNAGTRSMARLFSIKGGVVSADSAQTSRLRLTLPLLYSPFYNPFTGDADNNGCGTWAYFKSRAWRSYVPVRVLLVDASGTVLYHYKNSARCSGSSCDQYFTNDKYSTNTDGWVAGAPTGTTAANWECWLAYYDTEDEKNNSGLGQWATNKHAAGWKFGTNFPESYKQRCDGELLLAPPVAGTIVVEVWNGVYPYDNHDDEKTWGTPTNLTSDWLNTNIRWYILGAPQMEVVIMGTKFETPSSSDIEYSGVLLAEAKDDIEVDTTVGSTATSIVGARGVMINSATGAQLGTLTRAGRTDSPEQLLIGTYYSQHASRHLKLTGTVRATAKARNALLLTDQALSGQTFVVTGSTHDLRACTSDITAVEISADSYTSV